MKNKTITSIYILIAIIITVIAFILSILIGKYPITPARLWAGDPMAVRVFFNLRLPRALMALLGGFGLGIAGFIYQTVFRNPLASPDIVGISSGASVGAAFSILFISSTAYVMTLSAFVGGFLALSATLLLSLLAPGRKTSTIVLSGIAVHSLAQTCLMILKLMADPEKQLASIEYWIMGSFSGTTLQKIPFSIAIILVGSVIVFLLHRQILLLAMDEHEAHMLGLHVPLLQIIILGIATFMVAAVISVSGLISFVGLLAPHIARLLTKHNKASTMLLSGFTGCILLLIADTLAKSIATTELPVSVFTSLIGVPFFIYLIVYGKRDDLTHES